MEQLSRDDIHLISQHSTWREPGVDHALKAHVYPSAAEWQRFLRLLSLGLGVAFTTAGILFFFAYNWADLPKFAKMGIIEALLLGTMAVVLFARISLITRQILLTGASMLVGVLFAVYGQVYQTGANAYDFFLGWTAFVTLWVAVSGFAPLWLLYLTLINTTAALYLVQVARDLPEMLVINLFLAGNALFLVISLLLPAGTKSIRVPTWLSQVLALAVASLATLGLMTGIMESKYDSFWQRSGNHFLTLIALASVLGAAGLWYGLKRKSGFYLAVVPFCVLLMGATLLLRLSDDTGMLLFISLFIVAGVTLIIRNLIHLSRSHDHTLPS